MPLLYAYGTHYLKTTWWERNQAWVIVLALFVIALVVCGTLIFEEKSRTKYATTPPPVCEVIFEHCYDGISEKQTVAKGSLLTAPIPMREGFEFRGWFWDTALTLPLKPEQKVQKNCVLYAKWEKV